MTILTKNFTLEELTASATAKARGIKNTPDQQAVAYLAELATRVLQPLRDWYGAPILIGSGYRSAALNKAVGGVANSQHMLGQAVDLFIDGDKNRGWQWFNYIQRHLPFDQLIWEHNSKGTYWVHVSLKPYDNRGQVIDNLLKK